MAGVKRCTWNAAAALSPPPLRSASMRCRRGSDHVRGACRDLIAVVVLKHLLVLVQLALRLHRHLRRGNVVHKVAVHVNHPDRVLDAGHIDGADRVLNRGEVDRVQRILHAIHAQVEAEVGGAHRLKQEVVIYGAGRGSLEGTSCLDDER
eukprot:CAMPEP_0119413632 /NCGR_PEP_ID=MMETSP1335-20130426/5652_1 /TAXON_ID=259385 /ORGANISM="Chrysoculter rhomboideus, Strain RCC1486" /LENGTH=149 /DNA_ID=CAMNT_0007438433 /DNA_START=174 /DNA_END=620 /DNA_ORIENTATION=-